MFDVAWSELMVVAVVGLVVVGPKDLPRTIRTTATLIRRARSIQQGIGNGVAVLMTDIDRATHRQAVADLAQGGDAIPDPFAPPAPRADRRWRHDDSVPPTIAVADPDVGDAPRPVVQLQPATNG